MPAADPLCRCGHSRGLHEHLRRGTDCATCGAERCAAFAGTGSRVSAAGRRLRRLAQRSGGLGTILRHPTAGGRSGDPETGPDEALPKRA